MEAIPTIHLIKTEAGNEKIILPYPTDATLPKKLKRKKKQYHKKDPVKQARLEEERALKVYHKEVFKKRQRTSVIKQQLCRFCCEKKSSTVSFKSFEKWEIDVNSVMLSLELKTAYNEHLSEIVCEECFSQIFSFCTFKENCRKSEKKILRELSLIETEEELSNHEKNILEFKADSNLEFEVGVNLIYF